HLFVINKMDRPGADFAGTLAALQEAYGRHVVAEQWPIGSSEHFRGYVDLAELKAHTFDGDKEREDAIPGDLQSDVQRARGELLEAMADFDDHLMEELLEGIDPPMDEVERDLCSECSHDQIVPVLVASGVSGAGVAALVRAMEKWFPSPADGPQVDAEGRPIAPDASGPVVARVIKTSIHPQSGKLSIARILSGTVKSDATLTNVSKDGEKVRLGGLYRLQGKKQEAIGEAGPGTIVAFGRLESVATGDTLTSNGHKVLLPRAAVAEPVFAVAIKPKERIDEAKISQMLARIVDEDPALRLDRADVTHELLLLGRGEQHVSIAVERLARKYKVEVDTAAPTIPYVETIANGTEIHSRYKHQTGGHGQFGDVWLRFEPRERGSGVTFEQKIVGGVVPRQFIPAVEKGVREALVHGTSGYPVTDLHVVLFDGQYHDVDSSEQSFKTAAGMGVREALPKCNPVVLEPIVAVSVIVPNSYTSTVIQQLTGKRGQILGMNPADRGGYDVVEAYVPQVELSRYITELRTATQGLATYSWRHERYDPVPGNRVAPKAAV
ncbi:MAG TPA: elongation factor G, partial [Candidatus Baltobacteraceae bacterium]|nr:elongation factor G [Candidatus Baltobacteraceae bacterium]